MEALHRHGDPGPERKGRQHQNSPVEVQRWEREGDGEKNRHDRQRKAQPMGGAGNSSLEEKQEVSPAHVPALGCPHIFNTLPYASSTASFIISDSVGCGEIVRIS